MTVGDLMKLRRIHLCLASVSILALLLNSSNASASSNSREPLLVIWQDCEAPGGAKDWPKFPTGLIAAVWPDGRIIRATEKKTVGQKYVEGKVARADSEGFFKVLASPNLLEMPDKFSVAVDGPSRTVIIRESGKKHQWTRDIPDEQQTFNNMENRLWGLSLEKVHPVDAEKAKLAQYRPR
jgi:hypothetical protein